MPMSTRVLSFTEIAQKQSHGHSHCLLLLDSVLSYLPKSEDAETKEQRHKLEKLNLRENERSVAGTVAT